MKRIKVTTQSNGVKPLDKNYVFPCLGINTEGNIALFDDADSFTILHVANQESSYYYIGEHCEEDNAIEEYSFTFPKDLSVTLTNSEEGEKK